MDADGSYSATTQMLSEWLLNSGAYMHWMPAKPVWYRPPVDDARRVFEDVVSLRQVVYEEVARCVLRGFVVREAVLEFVSRKDIQRLGAAVAIVLEVDVFQPPLTPRQRSTPGPFPARRGERQFPSSPFEQETKKPGIPLLGFVASCFSYFSNGATTGKYRR